jgi:hypothetical protein
VAVGVEAHQSLAMHALVTRGVVLGPAHLGPLGQAAAIELGEAPWRAVSRSARSASGPCTV